MTYWAARMRKIKNVFLFYVSLMPILGANMAIADGIKTYINPIDIEYKYNFEQINEKISYRTGADPVFINYKGEYYLFETLADGYFHSKDMINWDFIKPNMWPMQSIVAPAVTVDGDKIIILSSRTRQEPLLYSDNPKAGEIKFFTRLMPPLPTAAQEGKEDNLPPNMVQPGPWDPDIFKDDDGKIYLYWGSSNVYPIYGMQLDSKTYEYVGIPQRLYKLDPQNHGFERFGQDHKDESIKPFIEGAWMNKVGSKYYLQYGAPGTEYNAYANGTYVADSPLGEFKYAPYNPVAYKPGGFVQGAGHGSTWQDNYGNYWNSGTPWIGVNWPFERRIAMFPTKFYDDGQMSVNTRFGDLPHYMPTSKIDNPESLFTGWMLLSYKKPALASSSIDGHEASAVTDENPRTFWVANENKAGENLLIDLGSTKTINAAQINFADYKSNKYGDDESIYSDFILEYSIDGKSWGELAKPVQKRDRPNAYFELASPIKARFVRYIHGHVGAANLAISDIRIFGNAGGKIVKAPKNLVVERDKDARNAFVTWQPVKGAVGYNIRWGIKPDRLNLNYQIFADEPNTKEIRALNNGVSYYFAIEAFDENGVSGLSKIIEVK